MKPGKIGAALLLTLSALLSPLACYGDGFVKGTVEFIRIHDAASNPSWAPPRFWFTLNGVTSAGGCLVNWHGRVLFAAESKEFYATVLTAYMTGKELAVFYRESETAQGGYCRSVYITIGDPPPMF